MYITLVWFEEWKFAFRLLLKDMQLLQEATRWQTGLKSGMPTAGLKIFRSVRYFVKNINMSILARETPCFCFVYKNCTNSIEHKNVCCQLEKPMFCKDFKRGVLALQTA